MFSSFARQVVAHLDDYGVAEGARVGTTLVDLLTAALAARLDRAGELPADTRQEALRRRVHAFIEQRLADPAHFSRLFRAAYGVPPLEYRRTMGGASGPG